MSTSFFQSQLFRKMLKFMSVGFFSLSLSMVILRVAAHLLRHVIEDGGPRFIVANSIAFAITVTTAFLMNSRFTFREKHADAATYVRYWAANLIGFLIYQAFSYLFVNVIAGMRHEKMNELQDHFALGLNAAALCAAGISFFWNFFSSHYWVFRDTPDTLAAPLHPS